MITAARQCGCPEPLPQRPTYPPFQLQSPHPHGKQPVRLSSATSKHSKCVSSCRIPQIPVQRELSPKHSEKIVSDIAKKGLPYKEIEAVINDNRVVIRIQKGERGGKNRLADLYDPPCYCESNPSKPVASITEKQNLPLLNSNNRQPDATFNDADACRTMTVFPQTERANTSNENIGKTLSGDGEEKQLEDNPNIFLLKIRRTSNNGDKKRNMDLEFRTPRPWSRKSYAHFSNMQKGIYSDPQRLDQHYTKCRIADNSCPHRT